MGCCLALGFDGFVGANQGLKPIFSGSRAKAVEGTTDWGRMSGSLFDGLHNGLKRVIDLRGQQHTMTAQNIAHRDTPGYRAKELQFDSALAAAVASEGEFAPMRTNGLHMGLDGAVGDPPVEEHEPDAGDTDGNSVDLEKEQARMAENLLLTNAVTDGLSRRLAILKFAASDGRR